MHRLGIFVSQARFVEGQIVLVMHWMNQTEVNNSIVVDSIYLVNSDLSGRIEIDHISLLINETMFTL